MNILPTFNTILIMKSIKSILVVLALMVGLTASAQFRAGVKVGTEINSMHLDKTAFSNDNRAGFTGGVMCEFTVPVVNLGFDLSVMYVHRISQSATSSTTTGANADTDALLNSSRLKNRDYIEIPLNLKYKLGLPVIGKVFTPYVFTGPSFSVLTSKRAITNAYKNKAFDVAWNVGLGVQLINHLQIGASYGIGLNKTVEYLGLDKKTAPIEGKNNYWTVTAAWLF